MARAPGTPRTARNVAKVEQRKRVATYCGLTIATLAAVSPGTACTRCARHPPNYSGKEGRSNDRYEFRRSNDRYEFRVTRLADLAARVPATNTSGAS